MNLRCFYCQTPFTLGRAEMLAALQRMYAENLNHYDAHCPHCRRANSVSRERLELFFPNWRQAAEEQAANPPEPASTPPALGDEKPMPAPGTTPAPVMERPAPAPVAEPAMKTVPKMAKPAAKKPARKRSAAKKKVVAKPAAKKKAAPRKKVAAKKPASKKPAAKKKTSAKSKRK